MKINLLLGVINLNQTMKEKLAKDCFFYLIFLLIGLGILGSIVITIACGNLNVTEDYKMYTKFKDITSTEKLIQKADELGLDYSLTVTDLTFDDYPYFYFTVANEECRIAHDNVIEGCILLDEHQLDSGIKCNKKHNNDGSITETCFISTLNHNFIKINDTFYAIHWTILLISIPAILLSIACGVSLYITCKRSGRYKYGEDEE